LTVLKAGHARALVTGPVSKVAISRAGRTFSGHTEHLAEGVGLAPDAVTMLFAGRQLRVGLVTTHLSLREVPEAITAERVVGALRRIVVGLRELWSIEEPRVVVLALNPHAGEARLFGDEEQVIKGAIARARRLAPCRNALIRGPVPSETGLMQTIEGRFDCALAMYHDQATIPCKLLEMGRMVNITLGLPFLRVSVAHGVAYDAAREGTADSSSMVSALTLAGANA
jgi:4-hydroxythreonine-4-phosphate dehydrogenase